MNTIRPELSSLPIIVLTDQTAASIFGVDPITGVQSLISSGGNLVQPLGIAVVPEPTAVLLLALGLALMWDRRRRSIKRPGRASGLPRSERRRRDSCPGDIGLAGS